MVVKMASLSSGNLFLSYQAVDFNESCWIWKYVFKIMLVIQLLSSILQPFLEEHQSQQPVNELWWFKVHGHHMVVKRERERLSLSAFLRTGDIGVHIVQFSVIGLGQEDEIEEITLCLEVWWHDAVYHEVDYCMKWPSSANIRIFWSWPADDAVIFWTSCWYLTVFYFTRCLFFALVSLLKSQFNVISLSVLWLYDNLSMVVGWGGVRGFLLPYVDAKCGCRA